MPDDVILESRALDLALLHLERRGKNLRGITPVIADMLVTAVGDVFEAEGPGWQPMAESTKRKRRGGASARHKLLQDRGILVSSIHPEHGPDWALAGTNVPYVVYHVSTAPRTIIPERNPFKVRDSVVDDVTDLILSHLVAE